MDGMRLVRAALVASAVAFPVRGGAGEARPAAADPVLEARVMRLSEELRCLVCQNQTLADSNASLAVDLRNQVRDMLASGRNEREAIDYLVARYGDFVLYRPPFKATTALLWGGPAVIVLLAVWLAARYVRATPPVEAVPDDTAARRADALLGIDSGGP